MATNAFELYGEIFLRDNDANRGLREVEGNARRTDSTLGKGIKTAAKWGGAMVLAAGAAAGAIGGIALKAAVSYEKQMANVATLLDGDVKNKIGNMSVAVKKMSRETGTSTELLTDGLYQVVSAFGETDDAMKILEVSTKGAAAGNATVTDSVNLLSAVTKGYGDTSSEAAQKASDLAFLTVKLGQTTFPELASSMGKVIPLAGAMKVSQEELFGAMATLTGVTGGTAEVTTQLRGAIQGFMKPTKEMSAALNKMGFETGAAALESLGLDGALKGLKKSVGGSDTELVKMFGSVEAGSAVLALTGTQAENFAAKTLQMKEASGATEAAFKTQQATVSAMMEKMQASFNVVMITLGEELLPMFNTLLEWVIAHMPEIQGFIDKAMKVVGDVFNVVKDVIYVLIDTLSVLWDEFVKVSTWISENQELVETFAIILGSFALAWGLVTAAMAIYNAVAGTGAVVSGLLAGAIALITSPITLVVLAIGAAIAIGILLWRNWDTIKAKASELKNNIKTKFQEIKLAITTPIKEAVETIRQKVQAIKDFFKNLKLSIPKPRLPHLRIIGKLDLIPPGISVPKLDWYARGTNNFKGGLAGINEKGGEIVNLPNGSQIIPHDISSQMAQNSGSSIVIETMNVRNDNDIKLIARELYNLQQNKNRALGVV